MFSITLKRSAATLGVVAGLLAAAAPASAMPIYMKFDDVAVVSRPDQTAQTLHHEGAKDTDALIDYEGTSFDVKAAVSFGAGKDRGLGRAGFNNWTEGNDQPMQDTEARVEGEMQLEDISLGIRGDAQDQQASRTRSLKDTMISGYNGKAAAEGTQVGSEGVKAPVAVLTGANDYGWTEGND
jgi:predicted heme/steroid binding protein